MDPLCTNLTYIFVSLFRDALNEYAYEAELAGLHYDLHSTIYGLTVCMMFYTITLIISKIEYRYLFYFREIRNLKNVAKLRNFCFCNVRLFDCNRRGLGSKRARI